MIMSSMLGLAAFLMAIPNVEMSREEARAAQAYLQVRQLAKSDLEDRVTETDSPFEFPELDPWGVPYRLIQTNENRLRLLSSGPNLRTGLDGPDADDIFSDMKRSPAGSFAVERNWQWLIAVVLGLATFGSILFFCQRINRRHVAQL